MVELQSGEGNCVGRKGWAGGERRPTIDEIHRKHHEIAQIFPLMEGEVLGPDTGKESHRLAMTLTKLGRLPIPAVQKEITDEGGGYEAETSKCDFKGGERSLGSTGNLFLQVEECNPHGIHWKETYDTTDDS